MRFSFYDKNLRMDFYVNTRFHPNEIPDIGNAHETF